MTFSRILRTKSIPPPRNSRTLSRPRVNQILKQTLDYRLTILQAEAGYGKSTALFAFSHIPNRLMKDSYDSAGAVLQDQFGLFVGGTVFCLAYLRSQNLFFVVGIHALGNRPSALFAAPNEALPIGLMVYMLATVLLLFWPKSPLVKHTTDKSESALAFMHDPEA